MHPSCTHVAIHARDIDSSVAFYERYVGLIEVHRRVDSGTPVVWMGEKDKDDGLVIVLIRADHENPVEPSPMAHLGYAVSAPDEVDRVAEMAERDGVIVQGPLDAGPIVGYLCMLRDPDGNWVEFSHGQSLGRRVEDSG